MDDNTEARGAPKPRRSKKDETLADLLDVIEADFYNFRRALSGYSTVTAQLRTATGELEEGERPRPPGILKHGGSLDGVKVIDCEADLSKVDPDLLRQGLFMLVQAHARVAVEAGRRAKANLSKALDVVTQATASVLREAKVEGQAP